MKRILLALLAGILAFASCKEEIDYMTLTLNQDVSGLTAERQGDNIVVSWNALDYEYLDGYIVSDDNTNQTLMADASATTANLNFVPGTHNITVQVKDIKGNTSNGSTYKFELTYNTLTSDKNVTDLTAAVEDGFIVLNWTAPDYEYLAGYKIVDALDGSIETIEDPTPGFSFPKSAGEHEYTVYVMDSEGNFSTGTTVSLTVLKEADIYVLVKNQTEGSYDVFKNGEPMHLFESMEVTPRKMIGFAIDGEDIYTAGWYVAYPDTANPSYSVYQTCYWKNGVRTDIPYEDRQTYISGIAFANGKLYLAGYDRIIHNPIIWEDGVKTVISSTLISASQAYSFAVDGTDVYMTYTDTQSSWLWKNGTETPLTGFTTGRSSFPAAMTVNDGDVYLGLLAQSGYLKNDVFVSLPFDVQDSPGNYVAEVGVSNGNVYAVGSEYNADRHFVLYTWKNGERTELSDGATESAFALAKMALFGDDFYVADHVKNADGTYIAKVWKNNEVLYEFNSGSDGDFYTEGITAVEKP